MQPSGRRQPLRSRVRAFLKTNVREDILLEGELLLLAFATGIGDATTYSEYRVFTANHTGNTIILAVGTTESWSGSQPVAKIPIPLILIGISLSTFIIAGWITGQLGNILGRRQRWWLLFNNFLQMLLVLVASLLQIRALGWNAKPLSGQPLIIDTTSKAVVALLAFSAGSQVAMTRSLQMTEITTANATSAYVDLLIDENLFRSSNRSRNRRLAFLVMLSSGSFMGGFVYQIHGSAVTLFISALGKTIVTILMCFNKGGSWVDHRQGGKHGIVQLDESSDSDLTYASRLEKECAKCVTEREAPVLSETAKYVEPEKAKYVESGYRNSIVRHSRDSFPRYPTDSYTDLSDTQLYIQIPSWTIRAATTLAHVQRHPTGI